eukprot:2489580-Rhodomonas_salina.2
MVSCNVSSSLPCYICATACLWHACAVTVCATPSLGTRGMHAVCLWVRACPTPILTLRQGCRSG